MFIVLVVLVVQEPRVRQLRCSQLTVSHSYRIYHNEYWLTWRLADAKQVCNGISVRCLMWSFTDMCPRLAILLLFLPNLSSRLTHVLQRWPVTPEAEVPVDTEVDEEAAVEDVAVGSRVPTLLPWVATAVGKGFSFPDTRHGSFVTNGWPRICDRAYPLDRI